MGWRTTWLRIRRRVHRIDMALHRCGVRRRWVTTPPPANENYVGWRVRWLGDSIWCRTPPGEPDIEVPTGTKGTVTEFVRRGSPGSYGYRITCDNGALWGTYLPAPWAIELTRGDTPPETAPAS